MNLKLKPYHFNTHPLRAILIKGISLNSWLQAIKELELRLETIEVYPLPGVSANSTWGCLVFLKNVKSVDNIGKHEFCQLIHDKLFIPELSRLTPVLSTVELARLFGSKKHFFHPELGIIELSKPIDWSNVLGLSDEVIVDVTRPMDSISVPSRIKSFQIYAVPPEEVLKDLEENIFPDKKKMEDKPLGMMEKMRLKFYQNLFKGGSGSVGAGSFGNLPPGALKALAGMLGNTGGMGSGDFMQQFQNDFEELEHRNKNEMEKLMDMLKNNPEEALKYAIPLDDKGSTRGGMSGQFTMSRRWGNFSLFGNQSTANTSGSVNFGDDYQRLRRQYMDTAAELLRLRQYEKAAFVYMRLLKDFRAAAKALEQGKLYQKAASIYLEFVKDKSAAARCYELGNYTQDAIELYKELNQHEKVGDLYLKINQVESAHIYFEKVIEVLKESNQFVKASIVYRQKMLKPERAQGTLLEGWKKLGTHDCLHNYLMNIPNDQDRFKAMRNIYQDDITDKNSSAFIRSLKIEYAKVTEIKEKVRDLAYEIIAQKVKSNRSAISELTAFNKKDKELVKDTIWFRNNRNWTGN